MPKYHMGYEVAHVNTKYISSMLLEGNYMLRSPREGTHFKHPEHKCNFRCFYH